MNTIATKIEIDLKTQFVKDYIECMYYALHSNEARDFEKEYKNKELAKLRVFYNKFTTKEILNVFKSMDDDFGFYTIRGTLTASEYFHGHRSGIKISDNRISLAGPIINYIKKLATSYTPEFIALRIANATRSLMYISTFLSRKPAEISQGTLFGKITYDITYKDAAPLLSEALPKHDVITIKYTQEKECFNPVSISNINGTLYINNNSLVENQWVPTDIKIIKLLCSELNTSNILEETEEEKETKLKVAYGLPDELQKKIDFIESYVKTHPSERKKINKIEIFFIPEYISIQDTIKSYDGYPNKEDLISYQRIMSQKETFIKEFSMYLDKITNELYDEELMLQDASLKVAKQINDMFQDE